MSSAAGSLQLHDGSALIMASVAQSLRFQAPSAWEVLEGKGLKVTYAAAPDQWSTELEEEGTFERLRVGRDVRLRSLLRGLVDVHRLLRREWTLVQVQSPVVGLLARVVPKRGPLIYVAHGFHFHADGSPHTNFAYRLVERLLAGRCDALGVVSGEDFATAQRLGFHRRTCLWRLPGAGVDLDRFSLHPRRKDRAIRLLYMGELNVNKDPLRFIEVVRRLRSNGFNASGTVIGDGPLSDAVRTAVRADGGSLAWVAYTDVPERFLENSDMLLVPSRREGLPRVIIEALAMGRPVVARTNRGSRELLTASAHGRLMAPRSTAEDWARAVIEVKRHPEAETTLRQSVLRYSVDAFAESYSKLIDTVLTQPTPRGAFDLSDQTGAT